MDLEKQMEELTPSKIVQELDKYIIGQDDAKKAVAIALRNRWRRQKITEKIKEEIIPNNIILIGPTGVGKTEIARRLAKLSRAPFIKVEATKYTEVGYVGRDVESIIRDLTDLAVNMVKAEKLEEVKAKAEDLAVEKILNIIASPSEDSGELINKSANSIDSEKDNDYREKTREWLREKIKKGEMDDREIEFTAGSSASNTLSSLGIDGIGMQIVGPINLDSMGFNFQDILSQFVPKKKKKRKATIKEAKAIFAQEEADKLIDMEAIVNEAIKRVQEMGIVFIDEIDKIVGNGKGHGPEVSREGVQRDLLPIVEGSTVSTKYGPVKTDHILFIASGAFHISKPSDLIPELQGRFPIRVELKSLTEDDFVKILTITENALLKQYKALLETEGIEVEFAEDGIREIAKAAAYVNSQVENIGARRLQTILSSLLDDILFNAPDRIEKNKFLIDADFVKSKISNLTQNKDLSRYIL